MVVFKTRKLKKLKKLKKNATRHTKYKYYRYTLKQPKRKQHRKTRNYYNVRKKFGGAPPPAPSPPLPEVQLPTPSTELGVYDSFTHGPIFLYPPPSSPLNFLNFEPSPPQSQQQQQPGPQVSTSIMSHQTEVNFSIVYFVSFFVLLCLCIKLVNIVSFFLNRRHRGQAHVREIELQTPQLPANSSRNELETLYTEHYQSYSGMDIEDIRLMLITFGESTEGTETILLDRLVRASLNINPNLNLMAGGEYILSPLLDKIVKLSNTELNPKDLAHALTHYVRFLVGTDYNRVAYLLININDNTNFEELITIIAKGLGMTYSNKPIEPKSYKILVKVVGESKTARINAILQHYSYNTSLNVTMEDIKFFNLKYEGLYAYLSKSSKSSNNNKIKYLEKAFKLINALNSKK